MRLRFSCCEVTGKRVQALLQAVSHGAFALTGDEADGVQVIAEAVAQGNECQRFTASCVVELLEGAKDVGLLLDLQEGFTGGEVFRLDVVC